MTKAEELRQLLEQGTTPEGKVLFHPLLMQYAARLVNSTYAEFMTDYRVLVESNIKCIEMLEHDAVGLISDPYRETSAFGATIEFSCNKSPHCDPIIHHKSDIENLKNPNVYRSARTLDRIKAAEYYTKLLGTGIPIIGWVEGPLAEAADLAGVNSILMQILTEPDFVLKLMMKCLTTAKDFARAQIEAGCLVVGIGDAICSQIDAGTYESYVLPLHQELFEYIHTLGAFTKLHICGDITHLLPLLARAGPDILDLDWMVSFDDARKAFGNQIILCGNLDPVSCIQNLKPYEVYQKSEELIKNQQNHKFILSGGCEITPESPEMNLRAMRKASLFRKLE